MIVRYCGHFSRLPLRTINGVPSIMRTLIKKEETSFATIFSNRKFTSSVPDGLLDLVDHQLAQQGGDSLDFHYNQMLQQTADQLKKCLEDKTDLELLLTDATTDPEMVQLAKSDLGNLEEKAAVLVEQIKVVLIPKTQYDSEDAIIEVIDYLCIQGGIYFGHPGEGGH